MSDEPESARYRLLYELGCRFTERIELHDLLSFIIEKCRDALRAEGVAVLLLDKARNEFYFPYVSETDSDVAGRLSGHRFPAELGFAGVVLRSGHSLKIDDVQADSRHYHGTDKTTGLVTRNLIGAPLSSRQGPIGVVEVVNRHGSVPFSDDDVRFLEALSGSIAIALDNARLYAEARRTEAQLRTEVGVLRRDLARHDRFDDMIGIGSAMAEVFQLMETAAASSISVLIAGETGTGKELVARGIHRAGARADAPFLAINCAALPETLLESELFGHRRGAFTGAVRDSPGLFRSANGGSVFLDEVGEMPPTMQAKLLRVLEQNEVVPLGESVPLKVDVRVLSATNRDLRQEIKLGRFRDDLYYRIAVFPIKLPPLRERREDIPLLIHRALQHTAERHGQHISGADESALAALTAYDWPGNIRELQNEIERAVAMSPDGAVVGLAQLSGLIRGPIAGGYQSSVQAEIAAVRNEFLGATTADDAWPRGDVGAEAIEARSPNAGHEVARVHAPSDPKEATTVSFREARAAFEARFIQEALAHCDHNISRAAKLIGISRVQLQRKIKDYGLR
jgi:transcriptional regulator with GAF, ATPase, and Fis domain